MIRQLVGLGLITLAGLGLGCEGSQNTKAGDSPQPAAASAAKPDAAQATSPASGTHGPNERFYKVQQKLDQGGSLYLYMDVKDVLRNFLAKMQPMLADTQAGPEAARAVQLAGQVIDRLGLYGVNDLGLSVMPDGELQRGKVFINAPEGRQGALKLLGGEPHRISALDRLTSDTMLAVSQDFDPAGAWALVQQLTSEIGGPEAQARLRQTMTGIQDNTGLNLPAVFASLTGEFTLAMAQDPTQKLMMPGNGGMQDIGINAPELALMVGVKDDTLYNGLKSLLSRQIMVNETTTGTLRKLAIQVPPNPVWPVSPLLATDGKFVYLTTHADYGSKLITPVAGATLGASETYKKLSAGLPTAGNGLIYYSGQLPQMIRQGIEFFLKNMSPQAPQAQAMRRLLDSGTLGTTGGIALRVNEPDGILVVSRAKSSAIQLVPAAMVLPVGALAAIAVPNFLEAQSRAKVARAKADQRALGAALEAYSIDNNVNAPGLRR